MQFHQIKSTIKRKNRKRVGRGGKRGTYSGRGIKGQLSRSGTGKSKLAGGQTSLFKHIPKLGGFKSRKKKLQTITLAQVSKHFSDGDIVSPKTLLAKKLLKRSVKIEGVKVLGTGELTRKVVFRGLLMSERVARLIAKK